MSENQRLSEGSYIGPFKIIRMIGKGGMGEVYEALEESLGRKVALKIISTTSSNSERILNQFISEARALAQLNHKNVVTIFRLGQDHAEGEYYIAMEFIEGATLSEGIKAKKFQFKEMVIIIRQIISGLKAVHAANIIHRDLKPKNIIIQDNNQVKIVDFGVAEALMGEKGSAEAVGTINYLAPEVLDGSPSSRQSDIWSSGIIFYELFTGMSPFRSTTEEEIREEVKTLKLNWPVSTKVWLPEDLKKVVNRMCAHDLEERYQTIEEVYDDLLKISSGKKIEEVSKTTKSGITGIFGSRSFKSLASKSGATKPPVAEPPKKEKKPVVEKPDPPKTSPERSYLKNAKSISGEGADVFQEFQRVEEKLSTLNYVVFAFVLLFIGFGYFYMEQKEKLVEFASEWVPQENTSQQNVEVVLDPPKKEAKAQAKVQPKEVLNSAVIGKRAYIDEPKIKSVLSFNSISDVESLVEVEKALLNPVQLTWTKVAGAKKYEVHMSQQKDFTKSTNFLRITNNFTWVSAKPGTFYWKVRAVDGRAESEFSEVGSIELFIQAPRIRKQYINRKYTTSRSTVEQKVDWPALPYVFGYHVIVSRDRSFKSTLVKKSVSTNSLVLQVSPNKDYFVKVASIDEKGQLISSYSPAALVKTLAKSTLDTPSLLAPRNLASISNKPSAVTPLVLKWSEAEGAESYEIQISKDKRFRNNIMSSRVYGTQYTVSNPLPRGKVFWRIRANSGRVKSKWSTPYTVNIP